jgi:hypothetical protein
MPFKITYPFLQPFLMTQPVAHGVRGTRVAADQDSQDLPLMAGCPDVTQAGVLLGVHICQG